MFKQHMQQPKIAFICVFWINTVGSAFLGSMCGIIPLVGFFFFLYSPWFSCIVSQQPSICFSFGFGPCYFNWYFLFELIYRIEIYFRSYPPLIFYLSDMVLILWIVIYFIWDHFNFFFDYFLLCFFIAIFFYFGFFKKILYIFFNFILQH